MLRAGTLPGAPPPVGQGDGAGRRPPLLGGAAGGRQAKPHVPLPAGLQRVGGGQPFPPSLGTELQVGHTWSCCAETGTHPFPPRLVTKMGDETRPLMPEASPGGKAGYSPSLPGQRSLFSSGWLLFRLVGYQDGIYTLSHLGGLCTSHLLGPHPPTPFSSWPRWRHTCWDKAGPCSSYL